MPDGPSIAHHGLIGDLRTCALVATDGTIDWFCAPRFDSGSVFGAILDTDAGGSWALTPVCDTAGSHQFYLPESATLITRFLTEHGVIEIHDFMPVLRPGDTEHRQRLVRRIVAVRGTTTVRMTLDARPDYGRARFAVTSRAGRVDFRSDQLAMTLTSSTDVTVDDGVVSAEFTVRTGDVTQFVLEVLDSPDADADGDDAHDVDALFEATAQFWRTWLATSRYRGRWREMVERSAITLKLLTHEPSGAIIAAPTTSLPETIGGERNWDYRYVWMRDAGFSLYALLRLGFNDEANAFIEWLSRRLGRGEREADGLGPLRVLYDIDGNAPEEIELDHLRGHLDSKPVRVGNAAAEQLQLDIYGDLIDSVYLFNKYGAGISHDAWSDVSYVIGWVVDNWQRDDAGMWEVRDGDKANTTSRLMCWVALERAIRIARQRGLPADLVTWSRVRDEIYERIMTACWNAELETFTRFEDDDTLDAGVLLMPMVKFISPIDPRFLSTLAAIERQLVTDSLVFRYDDSDGLDGEEGTFSLCTFWYVEALTRAGRLRDAQLALEKMFTYANHVGLYAEQVSATGDQVGNFPQAFTHLSLISAAINLDRALG